MSENRLWATVPGSADRRNSAYGARVLGEGWSGRVWTRTVVALAPGSTLTGPLVLEQVRDADREVVYQVVATEATHRIVVVSPAGGLTKDGLRLDTGARLGGTSKRIEVSAKANDSVIVRVDGKVTNNVTGLAGATSRGQRSLRVGIVNYGGSGARTVTVFHRAVGVSTAGWLGSRTRSLGIDDRPKALGPKRLLLRLEGIPASRLAVTVRRHGRRVGHAHSRLGGDGQKRVLVHLPRLHHPNRLRVHLKAVYRTSQLKIVKRASKRVSLPRRERHRLAGR
jgi:hypothetical protein